VAKLQRREINVQVKGRCYTMAWRRLIPVAAVLLVGLCHAREGTILMPAIAGVTVHFAAVDVDDPSANTSPVDRETDGGAEIADNCGSTGVTHIGITPPKGVATATFESS
jgi:hypothetical protein